MAGVPRGVQVVKWRNADGSKSVRYRVRVQRKDFAADKLFETLDEAIEFRTNSKTKAGRESIVRDKTREEEITRLIVSPPLAHYTQIYKDRYIGDPDKEEDYTKRRTKNAALCLWKSIESCEVSYIAAELKGITGVLRTSLISPKKKLGDLRIAEITPAVCDSFIIERLKQVKPASVYRELTTIRAFFNRLHRIDPVAAKSIETNPFAGYDQKLLDYAQEPRDVRLQDWGEDAEKRLFDALGSSSNPEMLQIAALTLETGMRRSEVLGLTWEAVERGYIELRRTKTKPRKVVLTEAARKIIETIERKDEKLFHYTPGGFSKNWDRLREKAGLAGFRFHDMRRESISRMIESMANQSSVAVAALAGFRNPHYVEANFIEHAAVRRMLKEGIKDQRDLMRNVGHKSARMTLAYTALRKKPEEAG